MIDTQANPKSYLRLMALVALLGIVSAVVTFVFIVLVNGSIALIWEQAALAWAWTSACSPCWCVRSAACWSGCW